MFPRLGSSDKKIESHYQSLWTKIKDKTSKKIGRVSTIFKFRWHVKLFAIYHFKMSSHLKLAKERGVIVGCQFGYLLTHNFCKFKYVIQQTKN
jgi:hypothetical protein